MIKVKRYLSALIESHLFTQRPSTILAGRIFDSPPSPTNVFCFIIVQMKRRVLQQKKKRFCFHGNVTLGCVSSVVKDNCSATVCEFEGMIKSGEGTERRSAKVISLLDICHKSTRILWNKYNYRVLLFKKFCIPRLSTLASPQNTCHAKGGRKCTFKNALTYLL